MPKTTVKKEKVKKVVKKTTLLKKVKKIDLLENISSEMEDFQLDRVYKFLEPGPTILLITADKEKTNLVTLSYQMMMSEENALIACRLGPWDYSYSTLLKTQECVISIPTVSLINEVVKIGNCSGKDVDKFETFHLTKVKAKTVKVPLLKEALINIECKFHDTSLLKKYHTIILKAKKAWYNSSVSDKRFMHHNGNGIFTLDGDQVDLKELMIRWPEHVANR
jgi:flavin reductase (DIM6/NTAB) family NADH-FMN oxidoreductase RutF